MLAALAPALQEAAPDVAKLLGARVDAALSDGVWGDRDSYYLQNWAWFGTALRLRALLPFERVTAGADDRSPGPGAAP
jgi:hypothetical protein